jgi:copper(I)-binding protein
MTRMRSNRLLLALLAGMLIARAVHAESVTVADPWARAMLPGQRVAGVYMTLRSATSARIVGVSSPAARAAEVHHMSHEGGTMKMRKVETLALPAGKAVVLAPGGYHIMLLDVREPLQAGTRVKLTLTVEQDGKRHSVPVEAQVRSLLEQDEHKHH